MASAGGLDEEVEDDRHAEGHEVERIWPRSRNVVAVFVWMVAAPLGTIAGIKVRSAAGPHHLTGDNVVVVAHSARLVLALLAPRRPNHRGRGNAAGGQFRNRRISPAAGSLPHCRNATTRLPSVCGAFQDAVALLGSVAGGVVVSFSL